MKGPAVPSIAASVPPELDGSEIVVRVGVFTTVLLLTRWLMPFVVGVLPLPADYTLIIGSVLSSLFTGAAASYTCAALFEGGRPEDIGLGITGRGLRELLAGIAAGACAALLTIAVPLALGWATFGPGPAPEVHGSVVFALSLLTVVLAAGAAGEELIFHGYAFQLLIGQHGQLPLPARRISPPLAILTVAGLFGLAHIASNHAPVLAGLNTVAWGLVLGYACWRTGSLWLPIGLHFGWNVVFPLFGLNLSGITIGVSDSTLQWNVGELWSGGSYGPEGGLLTTASVALLWLGLEFSKLVRLQK